MARSGSVVVTHRVRQWANEQEKKFDKAVLEMATDIHRASVILAPKQGGALKKSARIQRNSNANYSVIFGGSRVPYARRRHFENKKNPQTLKYLETPGDRIARSGIKKYLRNK